MSFDNLTRIDAIFLYTKDKTRIVAQYYTNKVPEDQKTKFETEIFDYSQNDNVSNSLVFLYKNNIVIFSVAEDFITYIVGDIKCNELILNEMQENFYTALDSLLNGKVNSSTLFNNIGTIYLVIDGLIDQGYPFITDPNELVSNVLMKEFDNSGSSNESTSKPNKLLGFWKRNI